MKLTRAQIKTLSRLSDAYSDLEISELGPFLCVKVYVQSASSSGHACWYYNRDGEKASV